MKKIIPFLLCSLGAAFLVTPVQAASPNDVLDAYVKVSDALAADNLAGAKSAATDLAKVAQSAGQGKIANEASALAVSPSLDKAREQFKPLSNDAIAEAKDKKGYYVLTCPMAKADWVQKNTEVTNPYMGKSMLHCGMVKSK